VGSAIRGRLTVAERSRSDILLIVHWMDTNYHELFMGRSDFRFQRSDCWCL